MALFLRNLIVANLSQVSVMRTSDRLTDPDAGGCKVPVTITWGGPGQNRLVFTLTKQRGKKMAAFYEELFKQNATLWSGMSESMGSFGKDGISEMASFWRGSGEKSMERFLTGVFPSRIGPACFHQEKVDGAVKQLGALNVAVLEFTAYMMMPVEAAFKQAVKEVGSASTPEDWKAFGDHMMRHMEDGYQGLFTSKGYLEALDMLMVSAGDARHQMMGVGEDVLQAAGIPSLRETDAISKDLYQLRKRVGALEKGSESPTKSA